MTVDGRAGEPHCFTLDEADGDASTMLLGELANRALGETPTRAIIGKLCAGDAR
jgi:hypothetical protein